MLRRVLLLLLCLLLLCGGVCAAGTEVEELNTQVTVDAQGACRVTMTVTVQFSGATESLLIPLGSGADDIELAGWRYRVRKLDGVTCLLVSNEAGFTGRQTFVCSYRLTQCVSETGSGQRFCLRLPEYGWECGIASYRLELHFPVEVGSAGRWTSGYYNDVFDNYLDLAVQGNTLTAQSNTPLRDAETVMLRLDFPANSFDLRNQPGKAAPYARLGFYALLLLTLLYWLLRLRNPRLRLGQPHGSGLEGCAGEVPCQLFGELPDLGALLAHWGNLGYLQISRERGGRLLLHKRMEMGNERTPVERRLFHALFRGGMTCDVRSARFARATQDTAAQMRAAWCRRSFRPSSNPRLLRLLGVLAGLLVGLLLFDRLLPATGARWVLIPLLALLSAGLCALFQRGLLRLLHRQPLRPLALAAATALTLCILAGFGGCVALMLLNLLLQSFCVLATLFGGRRTTAGMESLQELLSLRRFLRRADRTQLQKLLRYDPQYFYRMLPYAETMGVGRAFAAGFGGWRPEPCAWLLDSRGAAGSAQEFRQRYADLLTALREAAPAERRPALPARRR